MIVVAAVNDSTLLAAAIPDIRFVLMTPAVAPTTEEMLYTTAGYLLQLNRALNYTYWHCLT